MFGEESGVDPETLEKEELVDEAFEIVVLEPASSDRDDWMPGEFDIT
jgi:hypothetical protein